MKETLTINTLIDEAIVFCNTMSNLNHVDLIGVTDGKAVGTYVEHKFKQYLAQKYIFIAGNTARGIDLPDKHIQTDIKVTSANQPQSSCPFQNARQKIYGLGYNLLVFVYKKQDFPDYCRLNFTNCSFIDKNRTADFITTKCLRQMLVAGANKEDIIAFLWERRIPGDEIIYNELAEEILSRKPKQGYLTISNALQWRLQYTRALGLNNEISGILNYEWN